MSELIVKVIVSYLLGSIVGSLWVGRLRGGVDIRKLGSGNAGGTNALRTQGKSFALWVLLIDIGKGWVATRLVGPLVMLHGVIPASPLMRPVDSRGVRCRGDSRARLSRLAWISRR